MSGLFFAAWRLVLKRAAADLLIIAAAFVTVLLAAMLLAAGPIYANAVALSGLERTLAEAPARDSGLQVSARITLADYRRTSARVEREVRAVFDAATTAVYRSAVSDSYSVPDAKGRPADALALFAFYDSLEEHATLVAGTWPGRSGPLAAAVPSPAARALGLEPGDSLTLTSIGDPSHEVAVQISGVYRPDDPQEAFWWGSPLETEGSQKISFTTFGPFVVSEPVFPRVAGTDARTRWRVAAEPKDFTVAALPGLRKRLDGLGERLDASSDRDMSVDTGLGEVLSRTDHLLTVTRSGVLIPSVQLAVLAGAALLFLAGLLAERRGLEAAIMRSRGAGSDRIAGLALMEGAMLAVPAALAAPWLAALGLRALNHVGPLAQIDLRLDPQVNAGSYALAVLAAALCVAALTLPALRSGAVSSTVAARGRPRPQGFFQRARLDLALVALALLAYWQLRRYEGPVVESVHGRLGIDPLLIAAPALGLLAGAALALRVVPGAALLIERLAAAARGVVAALGTRELARRPHRFAGSALLLTLALAIGLFASAYSRTWLGSQRDQADYQAAADVRVEPSKRTGSIPAMQLAGAYEGLGSIRAALPVYRAPLELSRSSGTTNLLAVDAARAPGAVRFRGDLADRPLAEVLAPLSARRPRLAAVPLPGRPARLVLDVTVSVGRLRTDRLFFGAAARPSLALVLRDADGLFYRLPVAGFGISGARRRLVYGLAGQSSAERPRYPLGLVAIETEVLPAFRVNRPVSIRIHSLAVSGPGGGAVTPIPAPAEDWRVNATKVTNVDEPPSIENVSGSGFLALDILTGTVATFLTPRPVTYTAIPGRNRPVSVIPAVATERFLAATGTSRGARIPLGSDGPALGLVGATRGFPTLPSGAGGVIVDYPTYAAAAWLADGTILAPTEWWVDVNGPAAQVADRLAAPPFSSVRVVDRAARARALSTDPVALGISGALYIGFVAAAVFAVIGFAVSSAISATERRTEFAVLRSLGLSGRQLSGALALEGGLTAGLALAAGTALGLVLAWLVLPFVSLSDQGARPFPDVIVHFPWATAAWLEGALLAALALVVLVEIRLLGRIRLAPALRAGEDR